jgi:hypothetical protein
VLGIARRLLVSIICLALAGMIGLAAIADHSNKQDRMNRVEIAEWSCAHQHKPCGGPSSNSIEARWNQRQLLYEIVVVGLAGAAIAIALPAFRRFRSIRS